MRRNEEVKEEITEKILKENKSIQNINKKLNFLTIFLDY